MRKWESFEEESTIYLNEMFQHSAISFTTTGGKVANASDIEIINNNQYLSSIEVKFSPAQSGQFAVLLDGESFIFSSGNRFEENASTRSIINHLNENYSEYMPKAQGAIDLNLSNEILYDWIKTHYKRKDSFIVITSTKLNDFKAILHIDELEQYFNVSACIRRKRSGSRHVPKKMTVASVIALNTHLKSLGLEMKSVKYDKGTYVELDKNIELNEANRRFGENFYLSSSPNSDGYYIKVLSTTNNLNIIFSLNYIGPNESFGLKMLEDFIAKRLK